MVGAGVLSVVGGTRSEGVLAEATRDPRKNVERLERLAENTGLRTAQWQKCLERLECLV